MRALTAAARLCAMLACLAMGACASTPVPVAVPADQSKNIVSPACKLEGCCEGHGQVALLQPDRFVMCTDGEPSRICDCH
jgi:hypothetical protein